MKSYLQTLCCAALLMACAIACTDIYDVVASADKRQVSITGEAESFTVLNSTRTQVGSIADDGALTIEWSPGDRVGVFGGAALR